MSTFSTGTGHLQWYPVLPLKLTSAGLKGKGFSHWYRQFQSFPGKALTSKVMSEQRSPVSNYDPVTIILKTA
jgi:hypothetical protein